LQRRQSPGQQANRGRHGSVIPEPRYGNYVDVAVSGETGWVVRFAHLETVKVSTGDPVTPQTPIGTVGASGLSGNPLPYHLHYEQRLKGVVQAAVFNGSAISYAYSLPGNSYTSANCGETTGRIGALDSNNVLWVKDGAVGAQWQQQQAA
jgi:murein DD-endopeptidase MepM/ murein hydrolase activator NlpD